MTLLTNPDQSVLWRDLIQGAEARSDIHLPLHLENYLTQLVCRFVTHPDISHKIMGIEWISAMKNREADALIQVGDECLLLAGLFPQHLTRRSLNLNYFIKLGQSAYGALSLHTHDLYEGLSRQFVVLTDVLFYVRESAVLSPYDAYCRARDIGSEHALRILSTYEGIAPFRRR